MVRANCLHSTADSNEERSPARPRLQVLSARIWAAVCAAVPIVKPWFVPTPAEGTTSRGPLKAREGQLGSTRTGYSLAVTQGQPGQQEPFLAAPLALRSRYYFSY